MKKVFTLSLCLGLVITINLQAQEIDVMTYNIRYASADSGPSNWYARKEGVFDLLKNHDFIGLQEVMPVQKNEIHEVFRMRYGIIYRTRENNPSKGEGTPILYDSLRWTLTSSGTFWLSATPGSPGSNTWGAAFPRVVTFGIFQEKTSSDSVLVINTHFDHVSQVARENSIDLILSRFDKYIKAMPLIFMGDLNVSPDNKVYRKIMDSGTLTDSYYTIHPGKSIEGATFHGWNNDFSAGRIDYIFLSGKLDVKSSEVIHFRYKGEFPSDHLPVHSVLSIKK